MTYDVACPVCGRINRSLYLEETEGWMECEYCGHSTQDLSFQKMVRIPVIRMEQLSKMMPLKLEAAAVQ
ncbi:MAG: translation initiation factor 2 [Eubacterium sp.]|nr:translation initiation factor 2 [Eubacterium sp.]